MKNLMKFFPAALAAFALASCSSEDLKFQQNEKVNDVTHLTATFSQDQTRTAAGEGDLYKKTLWTDGDVINVYTPNILKYNTYNLTGGEGTEEGDFTLDGTDNLNIETAENLYAVTGSEWIYGVSSTKDGKPFLTTDIPSSFSWDKVAVDANSDYYVNPAPFWGQVTLKNGKLAVAFKNLVGLLKVDVAKLPVGTKGLWIGSNEDAPLSGTFNAVLEGENVLGSDDKLVSHNSIYVEFDDALEEEDDRILYVPIIAQKYENLNIYAVLAAMPNDPETDVADNAINPENDNTEANLGTNYIEVEKLENVEIKTGITPLFRMVEQEVTVTSLLELSKAAANLMDGTHAVRIKNTGNITVTAGTDDVLYIPTNVAGNMIINQAGTVSGNFSILEAPAKFDANGDVSGFDATKASKATDASAASARTVTFNINAQTAGNNHDITAYLPTTNLTLGNTNATNHYDGNVAVTTASTSNVSNSSSQAGLVINGVYDAIAINDVNTGAVYVKKDVATLTINPETATNVRIDDATVTTISYTDVQSKSFIYTTGSAAITTLTDANNVVAVRSYYTGKTAAPATIGTDILTVGQLAGLTANGAYTISTKVGYFHLGGLTYPWVGPVLTGAAAFSLDCQNRPLQSMNLNAKDVKKGIAGIGLFRSITGATTVSFSNIDFYDATLETTAEIDNVGTLAGTIVATGALTLNDVKINGTDIKAAGKNVGGMIGSVECAGATIDNINLVAANGNNVHVHSTGANVGGLIGAITSTGAINLGASTAVKVTANTIEGAANVGGLIGSYESNTAGNIAKTTVKSTSITGEGNNVGGLVGNFVNSVTGNKIDATVETTTITSEEGFAVGGLIGNLEKGAVTISSVDATSVKATTISGAYALGGMIGYNSAAVTISSTKKTTVNITGFATTQADSYFNTDVKKMYCGSIGYIIGYVNADFTLTSSVSDKLSVPAALTKAQRKALQFTLNEGAEDVFGNTKKFYGETKSYFGFVAKGDPKLDGVKMNSSTEYNIYLADADYED